MSIGYIKIQGVQRRPKGSLLAVGLALLSMATFSEIAYAKIDRDLTIVRFGFSETLVANVNANDALAATKIWSETVGVAQGLWEESEAHVFEDLAGLLEAVNAGHTDIVALATREYVEIEEGLKAEPALTYMHAGHLAIEYVLITHRESGIRGVEDLKNKRVAMLAKGAENSLAGLWCDVLLMGHGLPAAADCFLEDRQVQKASQAVLPVYFRQIDAAVITKSAFATVAELNPQLGKQLIVLESSQALVPAVVCLRSGLSSEFKTHYTQLAIKLHEQPGRLQAFMLFKVNRLLKWKASYLDSVRQLMAQYRELRQRRIGKAERMGDR